MKIMRAFRYEVIPRGDQESLMGQYAGAARAVYNAGLQMQRTRYRMGGSNLSYAALCKELTACRRTPELSWLREIPIHPLQQALKDLGSAFKNFFEGHAEYPTFRKRGRNSSFRFPDRKQIVLDESNSRIRLPKLGWLRYRKSRSIACTVSEHAQTPLAAAEVLRNTTISERGGRWAISIQVGYEVPDPVHPSPEALGIDLGINNFAATSEGELIAPLIAYWHHMGRLAQLQRQIEHKRKGSANWRKLQARISRLHVRTANCRNDFLHKFSTRLSKSHALVAVEALPVKNMSASASGTVAEPGKNVAQKSGLNRSILDQGWGEFRRQLRYKLGWAGGLLIEVDPRYTSQRCVLCGHAERANRPTQSDFECRRCGHTAHADVNAAQNILADAYLKVATGSYA